MRVEGIDHVALSVSDVGRSVRWYSDVLGLERRHPEWGNVPAMVCAGQTCVALFENGDPAARQIADEDGWLAMRHLAFRVDRQMFDRAQEELRAAEIEYDFQDHDIAHSIYFGDPDGHMLELTTYEV